MDNVLTSSVFSSGDFVGVKKIECRKRSEMSCNCCSYSWYLPTLLIPIVPQKIVYKLLKKRLFFISIYSFSIIVIFIFAQRFFPFFCLDIHILYVIDFFYKVNIFSSHIKVSPSCCTGIRKVCLQRCSSYGSTHDDGFDTFLSYQDTFLSIVSNSPD